MHSPSRLTLVALFQGRLQQILTAVLLVYLVSVWFFGGATVDVTAADEWLSMLAWIPLLIAASLLMQGLPQSRLLRVALLAAAAIPFVPILQLIGVPLALQDLSSARTSTNADLLLAGVTPEARPWSLSPEATVRGMLALVPCLACFVAAMAVDTRSAARMAMAVVFLVLANLAFGLFQAGLPPTSSMRLYDATSGTGFGGIFANGNHQASALMIGAILALGLCARERRRKRERGQARPAVSAAWASAAAVCLVAIPIAASSAAMLIAILATAVAIPATGLVSISHIRRSRGAAFGALAACALLAVGLLSAPRWLDLKSSDAVRYQLADEVMQLGSSHAPLGSGIGTFVDTFAQSASRALRRNEYINHAHNEYAQWWLEGGVPAAILMLTWAGLLVVCGMRLVRGRPRDPAAIACWLSLIALMVHSFVDFPLRTTALMSVAGLLAGLSFAAAARTQDAWRGAEGGTRSLQPS